MFGADGWSYADVLPYFMKSEHTDEEELLQSGFWLTESTPVSAVLFWPHSTRSFTQNVEKTVDSTATLSVLQIEMLKPEAKSKDL